MPNDELVNILRNLAIKTTNVTKGLSMNGQIQPDYVECYRPTITSFGYGSKGITTFASSAKMELKPDWRRASSDIRYIIQASPEYSEALEAITSLYPAQNSEQIVQSFCSKLAMDTLASDEILNVDKFIGTIIQDLNKQPIKLNAEVELDGIVINVPSINISNESEQIILRPTTIDDLQRLIPVEDYKLFYDRPTAFLEFITYGRGGSDIQKKIDRVIVILRLFGPGSVRIISYVLTSESPLTLAGTMTRRRSEYSHLYFSLSDENCEDFKRFYSHLTSSLPESFFSGYSTLEPDYRNIAYERYSDALIRDGRMELRITNAVMGLEGLYLDEKDEVSFKLRMRAAKTLGLMGMNPIYVLDTLREAYAIRSTFVHGFHMRQKQIEKISSQFGSINDFLQIILNYLRVSIVLFLLAKTAKKDIISLIDKSMVDGTAEKELIGVLSSTKEILFN